MKQFVKLLFQNILSNSRANPMSSGFVRDHSLPSSSSVQSALLKLVKSGLVSKTANGYSLADPLLRVFINGLYATPELDISGF